MLTGLGGGLMTDPVAKRATTLLILVTLTFLLAVGIAWQIVGGWGSFSLLEKAGIVIVALGVGLAWFQYLNYLGRKSQRLQASGRGQALKNMIRVHMAVLLRALGEAGLCRDIDPRLSGVIQDGITHEVWLHFMAAGLLLEESSYRARYREAHGRGPDL